MRIVFTALAALFGLAFGSFLNVCLSRWPKGESIVSPGSHCPNCGHVLAWWENIPLLSWIVLRGRCRSCSAEISWRYPAVELGVSILWGLAAWKGLQGFLGPDVSSLGVAIALILARLTLLWILVALAFLDLENLWLPDALTIPGVVLGLGVSTIRPLQANGSAGQALHSLAWASLAALLGAAIILAIRLIYSMIRRREGMGLGDVKLMALLGAWLGIGGSLLAFFVGAILGGLAGIAVLLAARRDQETASAQKQLPFGAFLCTGGIVSLFWGQQIIAAYRHWAGF